MRYKSFQIQNYKGVRDTTLEIPVGWSNAVTLIGLNESGKNYASGSNLFVFARSGEPAPLY
jgi:hypothetical protein